MLDAKMRQYETAHEQCAAADMYMIARLDGRGFNRLAREVLGFDFPYDERFRDHMIATAQELMRCGMHVLYAYTQSDEISLLFHRNDDAFGRRLYKLSSILAATASASFSLQVGTMATFDCRISQLPERELVEAYFRWRSGDALRNALNAYCYWALRRSGLSAPEVSKKLHRMSMTTKHELLLQDYGIDFDDSPVWYRRGVGLDWETYEKELVDPETGESTMASRKRIRVTRDLPDKGEYTNWIRSLIASSERDDRPRAASSNGEQFQAV